MKRNGVKEWKQKIQKEESTRDQTNDEETEQRLMNCSRKNLLLEVDQDIGTIVRKM